MEADTELFCALFNETFTDHWGAAQFSADEFAGLIAGLEDLLDPQMIWFAEDGGETVGMVYTLPDLNQMPDVRHGVLLIIGVKQSHRGLGVNLALAARGYLRMIEKGFKSASYTIVLDDNKNSRRTAEKLGCRAARNFVVYRRELS